MDGWTLDGMDGWDGSPGWVKYRAPYGAINCAQAPKAAKHRLSE